MSAIAIREHAPTAPRIVPPPLRGWLVVFALHRVYLVASSAQYLVWPLAFWQSGPSLAAWQEQARRSMTITAIWLVVDVIGLVLLLRRDHRAPAYWMGRLAIGAAWFAMNVLPRLGQGLDLPVTSWALAVGLPALWLALWLRSPLVARTFGPAAERWWAPPRASSSGLTVSGLLLAALWLCLFATGWVFRGAGEWKLAVFLLYSLLALPLWVVTWAWGRQAGSAIAARRTSTL